MIWTSVTVHELADVKSNDERVVSVDMWSLGSVDVEERSVNYPEKDDKSNLLNDKELNIRRKIPHLIPP